MASGTEEVWTVLGTLQWTTEYFRRKGCDSPRLDAELLLGHALGIARIQLYVQYERPMDPAERERYRELVRRRGAGEPVAYILGEREFWSLSFRVRPGVLVPRPDTETLVQKALELANELSPSGEPPLRIADVGTGTGCVAISLATERPDAHVWAGDVAETPLELSALNATSAGVSERVSVMRADGLGPLFMAADERPFHLVVSNPPYLRDDEFDGLMRDVRDHEPRLALTAGSDGLDVIRPLVRQAAAQGCMAPGGALLLEIGSEDQARKVGNLMSDAGFGHIEIVPDLGKRARVVVGRAVEG